MSFNKYILLSLFLSVNFVHSFGQFSEDDIKVIRKKAVKLLEDYEKKINTLGKEVVWVDRTRINIESLIGIFITNKVQVYNDLDPLHVTSEYYEIETYASNIALWYPGGIAIRLNLDYSQVSNIISQGKNVYSIDFIVEKQISGLYMGKTMNKNSSILLFRIGFSERMGQFMNFKIAGIRKATEKEYIDDTNNIEEVDGVSFNPMQKKDIDRETWTVLNDYANYLSLIGDTAEDPEEKKLYIQSFKSLFINPKSLIYDDISTYNKNRFLNMSDYINLYSDAYALDGGIVKFGLDSVDLGVVKKYNDTSFYRIVQIDKSFEGNYYGKQKIMYNNRIAIKIRFEYSSSVYKKFRIDIIDSIASKKKQVKEMRIFTDLKKHDHGEKKPKEFNPTEGLNFRLNFGFLYGLSLIYNENLGETKKSLIWETVSQFSYSFYGHYTFMLGSKFGLTTGFGYSSIGSGYSLNSFKNRRDTVFQDPISYYDQNNNLYYKAFKVNYDSTVKLDFLNIPIGLSFVLKQGSHVKGYLNPGINIALINKATSSAYGYFNYFGYYPNETLQVFKYIDWPEFGSYKEIVNNKNQNIKPFLNKVNFIAFLSAGVGITMSRKISVAFMGNFQYGLSDLMNSKNDYADIYVKTETISIPNAFGQTPENLQKVNSEHIFKHKPNKIISYGIAIEFLYKL